MMSALLNSDPVVVPRRAIIRLYVDKNGDFVSLVSVQIEGFGIPNGIARASLAESMSIARALAGEHCLSEEMIRYRTEPYEILAVRSGEEDAPWD